MFSLPVGGNLFVTQTSGLWLFGAGETELEMVVFEASPAVAKHGAKGQPFSASYCQLSEAGTNKPQ